MPSLTSPLLPPKEGRGGERGKERKGLREGKGRKRERVHEEKEHTVATRDSLTHFEVREDALTLKNFAFDS